MLTQAFGFKRWADERTLDAVARIDTTNHSDSYAFMRQQLNHIVIVEELFRSRLLAEAAPHSRTNTALVPDLPELTSRLSRSNDWYADYVASVDDGDKRVSFAFADGRRGAMSIHEILFHILTHGSYHRGNIARALDLAGVPHPGDGYGIYIHENDPSRRET